MAVVVVVVVQNAVRLPASQRFTRRSLTRCTCS